MIAPWIHPPLAHQQAFHAKFGPAPNSPMIPNAGASSGAFTPNAVQSSAIREKVKPRPMKTFVHSAVKSPGMGGPTQSQPQPAQTPIPSGTSLGNL
jgi:hypothetical protein